MQSQHRYSEVNTLLARAEQEMSVEMDTAMHGDFNALRAQVAINDGDQDEAERLSMVAWKSCRWPTITAASSPHRCMAKFSIVRGS